MFQTGKAKAEVSTWNWFVKTEQEKQICKNQSFFFFFLYMVIIRILQYSSVVFPRKEPERNLQFLFII